MPNISFGEQVRRARIRCAFSQAELGSKLGVSQAAVSSWEQGRVVPRPEQKASLKRVLGDFWSEGEPVDEVAAFTTSIGSWLTAARERAGLSVYGLAEKAGLSGTAIYNIEQGRIANPRAQTLRRLAQVLKVNLPTGQSELGKEAEAETVGRFGDFDPYAQADLPTGPGVYVLYDLSNRPVYIGEAEDIRNHILQFQTEFWFRRPIVESGAYASIPNRDLREQIGALVAGVLKSIAVINKAETNAQPKRLSRSRSRSSHAMSSRHGGSIAQSAGEGLSLGASSPLD